MCFLSKRFVRSLMITILFSGMVSGNIMAQPLTKADWRVDLDFLSETLKSVHPNPFHRVPETVFDSTRQALERDIDRLNDRSIAVRMAGLVALISDGHTSLRIKSGVLSSDQWYPIHIEQFVEGLFIVGTDQANQSILGAQVIRLGNQSAEAAWEKVEVLIGGDNLFFKMGVAPLLIAIPEVLGALEITANDHLAIEVKLANGQRKTVQINPVSLPSGRNWFYGEAGPNETRVTLPAVPENDRDPAYQHNGDGYWYQLNKTTGQLYAQINMVLNTDKPVFLNGERRTVSLSRFADEVFKQVDAGSVRTLILDLRYNGGGNNSLAAPLVDGIAARSELNQKDRLFVITGRQTYSAAMNLASLLEGRTRATFVGEPPGGSPHHYGDATPFLLPHSRLRVNVSTLHWDMGVQPSDVREIMEPDIPVVPHFEAFKAGKDPVIAAIEGYDQNTVLADKMMAVYKAQGIEAALEVFLLLKSAAPPAPWHSSAQQLIGFGYRLITGGGSGGDIFRAFRFATEQYPNAPEAWYEMGRVLAFPERWEDAEKAFAKARELRPASTMIRRMHAAAMQKKVSGKQ